ncbi:hypothetical protein FRC96_06890 [Lujinxingia vulgaris]|uniref:ParB/Sulfiredoxin domain-containing protein n=1 Tax=Lujinxingia vulgaris TaxID=2600176 RepID=A0A5C6XCG7_9DELT|nr:hypothetical protein [Lujinxingia vulgaris]TXD39646.1 hypothetical protein FRC96_06890 [Lujinxingia vulgaris]
MFYESFRYLDHSTEGLLLTVPTSEMRGNAPLRMEFTTCSLRSKRTLYGLRLVHKDRPLLWCTLDPRWEKSLMLRAAPGDVSVIEPITAAAIRDVQRTASAAAPDSAWPKYFIHALRNSSSSPLYPGKWWVRTLFGTKQPAELSLSSRGVFPYLELPRFSLTEPGFTLNEAWEARPVRTSVIGLRTLGDQDDSRVKMWRKRARQGALPPLLLLYVSSLGAYILLDGHDRLHAALLEGQLPDSVALLPLRYQSWPPNIAAQRGLALQYDSVVSGDPKKLPGFNRALIQASQSGSWHRKSRVWPVFGGFKTWRTEVTARTAELTSELGQRVARQMLEPTSGEHRPYFLTIVRPPS